LLQDNTTIKEKTQNHNPDQITHGSTTTTRKEIPKGWSEAVNWRSTMSKRERTKRQWVVYRAIHRKCCWPWSL